MSQRPPQPSIGSSWPDFAKQTTDKYGTVDKQKTKTSQGKGSFDDPVIMVDPVEAKRLAAKQMQEIKAKEKLKRRRRAEAINGTLAMIGLTAGLVIEGQTGKGIPGQLAGYLEAFISLFIR